VNSWEHNLLATPYSHDDAASESESGFGRWRFDMNQMYDIISKTPGA